MVDAANGGRRLLTGMLRAEVAELLQSPTRARAALRWLWSPGPPPVELPTAVPGVTPAAWGRVRESCAMPRFRLLDRRPADDGALKLAVDLGGALVETVLIPARGRSTVCLSTQAGCTRACAFCATARLPFVRNLDAGEMALQFMLARAEAPAGAPARNAVFMGMGEPMDNLDEVLRAVEVLTQGPAPQLSAEHVTVSTSGVLPGLVRFLAESRARLALSLNGSTDVQRALLMPKNRSWSLRELLAPLREDAARRPGRLVFVEYVLVEGVNDADEDAWRLLKLLDGIRARVNLIPHNPIADCDLGPPPPERVARFQRIVHAGGIRCLLRKPRGAEVAGACGQLALKG